jgi:cytoskeletal protein RodZ
MTSVGQELKRERELRGISLREIAEDTKINFRFLQALEEDRFELLPGGFFTRGILRTYARYLGIEEHVILNLYQETIQEQEKPDDKEGRHHLPIEPPEKTKKALGYSVMAVFMTALLIVFFILIQKRPSEPVSALEKPAPAFVEQKESPPPEIKSETAAQELQLELAFIQETWIQVYADGELKLDAIQQAGERLQITAQESLRLNVGNAGGFTFTLNGLQGRPLGPSGAVINDLLITLDNFQEFLIQQEDSLGLD